MHAACVCSQCKIGTLPFVTDGVNIGPLIAGAGVIGLAIGFGAQTLVRDIIAGVFFLIDDAFRIGDYEVYRMIQSEFRAAGIEFASRNVTVEMRGTNPEDKGKQGSTGSDSQAIQAGAGAALALIQQAEEKQKAALAAKPKKESTGYSSRCRGRSGMVKK
jgi:hypothetical protein